MARRTRYHFPGATYHVMLRGNNGKTVFTSNEERCRFCLFMQEGVERYGHHIYAFCLMTNHIHLAIKVNKVPISKIIQNLSFRYTRFFNWRHHVTGHLFQGRFKSVLVDSTRYLKHLIRYIHLNPNRANMVDNPLNYRWSSHRAYMMQEEITWLEEDAGLMPFGETRSSAVQNFHDFVIAGIGLEEEVDFEAGCADGILGDDEFIERVKGQFEQTEEIDLVTVDLETLLSHVCDWYKIDAVELKKTGMNRRSSHIRSVTALLAREFEGVTLEELAKFCGREASGMSKAAARLETRMRRSDDLENEVEGLKNLLIGLLFEEDLVC